MAERIKNMSEKNIYELAEEIRVELHEIVDREINYFLLRIEQGGKKAPLEKERPLTTMPAFFKGQKPVSIVYPDGTETPARTWKNVVLHLLKNCAEDETMRGRLEQIRGKVFGRNRRLFADSGEGMDAPLEFYPQMFLESKFDTETLLKVVTNRIFDEIGYDYSGIRLKVTESDRIFSEGYAVETAAEHLDEPEQDGFPVM